MAKLLEEIRVCIVMNKRNRASIDEQKGNERLVRREGQLKQLSEKKKKIVTQLITKLHKAKIRGRQQKSAKHQVPRSTYYKSRDMWPSNKWSTQHQKEHSKYRYYNDPYYARNSYYYHGYYHTPIYPCFWTDDDCYDHGYWDRGLQNVDMADCEPGDAWENVDALVQTAETNYGAATSLAYLAAVHEECSELGIDVIGDISGALDNGAALTDKMNELETSIGVPPDVLAGVVDSSQIDLNAIQDTLPDIPEDETSGDYSAAGDDDAMEADQAIEMYAGAGPRDLDDGGPSFDGPGNAALSGARRRARMRKSARVMRRVRVNANLRLQKGYRNLRIAEIPVRTEDWDAKESLWPSNLVDDWTNAVRSELVKAMSESDLFDLPPASAEPHYSLTKWSTDNQLYLGTGIEVVLVTQCSMDRLPNLEAQLARWTGKASVAVYVKHTENKTEAMNTILSTIDMVRKRAKKNDGSGRFVDIAVAVVEGCMDDEPYPINYLRNVALLEAQRQHASLKNLAVLLVDVDFIPSSNLWSTVHSRRAAESVLIQRKVIVCPAFESKEDCPRSLAGLKKLVDTGKAEGFHQSHFPQGHGPTQFATFWEKSLWSNCQGDSSCDYSWLESYKVKYEKMFEPYVIMSAQDVPFYDERFQGYGLNKVSHLATVAAKDGEFHVLPGVFLVAPAHQRSESWSEVYGKTQPDENSFNQLVLKGLYYSFNKNLVAGGEPVVSEHTLKMHQQILQKNEEDEVRSTYGGLPFEEAKHCVVCN